VTLNISDVTGLNGNEYRAVFTSGTCTPANTDGATLTVSPNVTTGTITGTTPLCIGATPTFTSNGTSGGTWSSSAPGVASVDASTGVVTAVSAGNATISYSVSGCGNPAAATLAIVVSPNPSAGTVSGTTPVCIGGTTTYSSNGTSGGTWSSNATSIATVNAGTGVVTGVSAGTATITYTVQGCNGPYTASKSVTVSPNSLCTQYNGDYFKNTGSTEMGGSAQVTLVYNISADPNSTCNDISGLTSSSFNITHDGGSTVTPSPLVYDPATKRVTMSATIAVLSNAYSNSVTFTLNATGNYAISGNCADNPVVTVSANSDGFVTGGGFIIPTNSGGRLSNFFGANTVNGLKNNFGFNIKTNKSGKLQGNWNTVIRRREGDKVVVYQVKSNTANNLNVTKVANTTRYRADMTFTQANFKNLTCDVCPVDANNGTVLVTVYDNGEPGAGVDQIFITIRDKDGKVWYTSDASANHNLSFTNYQLLNQGNIQVHALGSVKTSAFTVSTQTTGSDIAKIETPVAKLDVSASPNPFTDRIRFTIRAPKAGRATLEVYNMLGQKVGIAFEGLLNDNETRTVEFNAPANHRSNLIYTFRMNGEQINGKLISIKQ
jgi:hypothetical protein